MVKFKTIKYKHRRLALQLISGISLDEKGKPTNFVEVAENEEEICNLVMSLVEDWDYIDEDTDEKIPVGEPDELSDAQYGEVMNEFDALMDEAVVPKVKAVQSSSGPTASKRAKSRAKRRSG